MMRLHDAIEQASSEVFEIVIQSVDKFLKTA